MLLLIVVPQVNAQDSLTPAVCRRRSKRTEPSQSTLHRTLVVPVRTEIASVYAPVVVAVTSVEKQTASPLAMAINVMMVTEKRGSEVIFIFVVGSLYGKFRKNNSS
ncbi:unknown protein [Seminavis robusta]|uniref:Uncharacterized protein n=1 Tax=Seminavis robusta TaxID=568900 RepID=A0A9N8DDZ7_9STRA|nr:unknown protein [Seminavis robusta]|eukprot:Sro95_g049281.1  (106) ;mRNA; f:58031-58348